MPGDDKLVHLNDLNWDEEVLKSDVPVLVDFSAVWWGPCKVLNPIIEKLSTELEGKVKVGKLDIDESPATSSKYAHSRRPHRDGVRRRRAQGAARRPHQPRKPAQASAAITIALPAGKRHRRLGEHSRAVKSPRPRS